MHEFSIAVQILESVLEYAQTCPEREILKVRLEIGELMGVEADQLRFCYDSIKLDTPLQKSSLEIEFARARVRCAHCQYEGIPKYWDGVLASGSIPTLQCPQCGKAAEAVQGHDCAIKSIQLLDSRNEEGVIPPTIDCANIEDECDPYIATHPDA
jgi:hydrogenase nickel incorporation protein HypA/HybF